MIHFDLTRLLYIRYLEKKKQKRKMSEQKKCRKYRTKGVKNNKCTHFIEYERHA